MKNLTIKCLSVLVSLPISALCYSNTVAPICPDVSILKTSTMSYSATKKPNEPVTVVTSLNKFGTQHYWSMSFLVSAGTLDGAINKARHSLSSLSFEYGPHYQQDRWICSYRADELGVLKVSAETKSNQ